MQAAQVHHPRHQAYKQILHFTVGAAFLGTPFQGSWDTGYTAAQLRIAVATEENRECSRELIAYLRTGDRNDGNGSSPLDELTQQFCQMIIHDHFKFPITCFYETRATNFSSIVKGLPEDYIKTQIDTNGRGIVG